ncbi:MAG: heavy metal translocating P-type ATPase [Oligoflexia bacterium]
MEALAEAPACSPALLCLHCQSPVPARSRLQFCCAGCHSVHSILASTGLQGFYSILQKTGERARPVLQSSSNFAWLDLPETRKDSESDHRMRFYLEGVHCAACVWLVEKLPELVPGVQSVRLDLGTAVATVELAEKGKYSDAARGLQQIGYRPHAIRESEQERLERIEDQSLLLRLGVAAAAAGNIMLMAISLYAGADGAFARTFEWVSFALSLPVMFYSAAPFYKSTWDALKARQLSIDVPVALGLQVSFWVSVANLWMGNGRIYFDSVTALVFLLLSSRYLLRRVQRTALKASSLAEFLMPALARRHDGLGGVSEVSISELKVGDELEVLPGDLFPADGEVISGRSSVNAALLTGESRPEAIGQGAQVFAGTQNGEGVVMMRVRSMGSDSRVGKILGLVRESQLARAPIVAFSDRVSRGFIAATLMLLPIVVLGAWSLGWQEALDRALALALVTCPCAFALATPLTFASALGRAARAGILVKGAEVLERLSRVGTVFFDKTGTLTQGSFEVLSSVVDSQCEFDAGALILAIEKHSRHPVARALRAYFSEQGASELEGVTEIREIAGKGVSASFGGRQYFIGASPSEDSFSRVSLFEDCRLVATFTLGDPVRSDAAAVVGEFARLGVEARLLSGDSEGPVRAVAAQVGIPEQRAMFAVSPEQKQAALKSTPDSLMAGDGANDAVALVEASVGVAVQGGLEAAVRASDVYLSRPGIAQVPRLIELGRETLKVVRRNFAVSLIYNAVAATGAVLGLIDPLFAALLMPASALAVFASARMGTRRLREVLS